MKRRRTALGLLLILFLASCGLPGGMATPQLTPEGPFPIGSNPLSPVTSTPMPGPLALMILHTNDVAGEVDPCG